MKNHLLFYLCLSCMLLLTSCATQPDSHGSGETRRDGLVLQQNKLVCQESRTGKIWQFKKGGPFSSQTEAARYASDLILAGYSDWRLPTKSELFNLYYLHYWHKDHSCVMDHTSDFWSTTSEQQSITGHWEDYLLCDPEFTYVKSDENTGFVRAVRP